MILKDCALDVGITQSEKQLSYKSLLWNMAAVKGTARLRALAGQAKPSPQIGQALGPLGVNMMEFCKQFNAKTEAFKETALMRVKLTVWRQWRAHLRCSTVFLPHFQLFYRMAFLSGVGPASCEWASASAMPLDCLLHSKPCI